MEDTGRQLDFLRIPVGEPGSGLVRYAAAMHLYQQRLISGEALEIFRICAPDDARDPIAECKRHGINDPIPTLHERKNT